MAITIKSIDILADLLGASYDPKLIKVVSWFAARNGYLTITSGYRPDGGIHATLPCRAVDIRSCSYDRPALIAADINRHWHYDPKRPWFRVCVYHNTGRGWHFHIQVHPNTCYVEVCDGGEDFES